MYTSKEICFIKKNHFIVIKIFQAIHFCSILIIVIIYLLNLFKRITTITCFKIYMISKCMNCLISYIINIYCHIGIKDETNYVLFCNIFIQFLSSLDFDYIYLGVHIYHKMIHLSSNCWQYLLSKLFYLHYKEV